MNRFMNLKVNLRVALVVTLGVLIFGVLLYCFYRMSTGSSPPRSSPLDSGYQLNPGILQETRGFKCSIYHDAKPVAEINTDRISIEKKKLGFFRLGFLNEARLENAFIKGYVTDKKEVLSSNNVDFEGILKRALPQVRVGNLSSIFIGPVKFHLYDGEKTLFAISAQRASINTSNRTPVFEGDVRVETNDQVLHAQKIRLLPGENTLVVEGRYTIFSSGARKTGHNLTTDIFLRSSEERLGEVFTRGGENV